MLLWNFECIAHREIFRTKLLLQQNFWSWESFSTRVHSCTLITCFFFNEFKNVSRCFPKSSRYYFIKFGCIRTGNEFQSWKKKSILSSVERITVNPSRVMSDSSKISLSNSMQDSNPNLTCSRKNPNTFTSGRLKSGLPTRCKLPRTAILSTNADFTKCSQWDSQKISKTAIATSHLCASTSRDITLTVTKSHCEVSVTSQSCTGLVNFLYLDRGKYRFSISV